MTDAEILYQQWLDSGLGKREFWREFVDPAMTYDKFHGLTWRYAAKMGFPPNPQLFEVDIGKPLTITGDAMVIGDVQLPTTDYWFAQLHMAVALKYLKKPRRLVVTGDLFNLDHFSDYAKVIGLPSFTDEIIAARHMIKEWLEVYDEIIVVPGNHDRRVSKVTDGGILMADLMAMVTTNSKVRTTNWGHVIIRTPHGEYRATHNRNYSINQLTVASELANKFEQHIICHHQHHLAVGWDRFKRFVIVDNGGLFDPEKMAYAVMDDSKSAGMKKGFTMLRDGVPHVFSEEPFTNWDMWLPERGRKRRIA